MIPKDQISIYFSGHNIKTFALAAIKSFILTYPEYSDRIYYFDDLSTDATAEELQHLGVNMMGAHIRHNNIIKQKLAFPFLSDVLWYIMYIK